jgi:hypothetical protein
VIFARVAPLPVKDGRMQRRNVKKELTSRGPEG